MRCPELAQSSELPILRLQNLGSGLCCNLPLYYIILYYTILHYTILYYSILHYTTLHYTTLYYTRLD